MRRPGQPQEEETKGTTRGKQGLRTRTTERKRNSKPQRERDRGETGKDRELTPPGATAAGEKSNKQHRRNRRALFRSPQPRIKAREENSSPNSEAAHRERSRERQG